RGPICESLEPSIHPHVARTVGEHRHEGRRRAVVVRRKADVEEPVDRSADIARAIDQMPRLCCFLAQLALAPVQYAARAIRVRRVSESELAVVAEQRRAAAPVDSADRAPRIFCVWRTDNEAKGVGG